MIAHLPMSSPAKQIHFVQLDALRGLAVLSVMIHHLVPGSSKYIAWGPLGVRIFFVLSGFLITSILLEKRDRTSDRLNAWLTFYYRRALRILPIYFLALGVLFVLDVPPVREIFVWLATFTVNFHMGLSGNWAGCLSHVWFLAVGEQFFFVWTLVLLFFPKRFLLPAILAMIVLAPVVRACAVPLWGWSDMMVWFSPLSSMDSLAFGALLGWLHSSHRAGIEAVVRKPMAGWVALVLFLVAVAVRIFWNDRPVMHFSETLEALAFGWVVYRAAIGFGGLAGRVLLAPALLYAGAISYGIYLFHAPLHVAVQAGFRQAGWNADPAEWAVIAASFGVSFLVAAASWHALEKPIAEFKKKQRLPSGGNLG